MRSTVVQKTEAGSVCLNSAVFRATLLLVLLVLASRGFAADGQAAADNNGNLLPTYADTDYTVDFWRTDQGLLNNNVNAILQTHDGYLWVGTAAGLNRFDGQTFARIGDETAIGLKDAQITALLESRDQALWIGTQGGGVFRLWHGQATRYTTDQGLANNAVSSLAEDLDGCVWIGTQRGLNSWYKGQLKTFASKEILAGDAVLSLHAGQSGVLWITTSSGVYRIREGRVEPFHFDNIPQWSNAKLLNAYEDRTGNLWTYSATFLLNLSEGKRYNAFRSLDPASSRVWRICEQSDGIFWIGTSARGLVRFYKGQFDLVGTRDGLDQCDVTALFADHDGNLWIGTSGNGLARLQDRPVKIFNNLDGLPSTKLTAVAADPSGSIWIGTEDAGLIRWNGSRFDSFSDGFPMNCAIDIQSLCFDGHGALWIATWGEGLLRIADGRLWRIGTAEGLSDNVVTALAVESRSNAIWAGTQSGGLHRISGLKIESFGMADGLTGKPVRCLLAVTNDPESRLVIGSEEGGLVRWDGSHFFPIKCPADLMNHAVNCIAQDMAGRLWVGTEGAGAFCRVGGVWLNLTIESGLLSDTIKQIIQDESGNIWFGSSAGFFRVRAGEMESYLLGTSHTVTSLLCILDHDQLHAKSAEGWPGVLTDSKGALWFASNVGLLTVNPLGIKRASPLPVIIEQVAVDGHAISLLQSNSSGQPLQIGPGMHSLDFSFTAINFTAPKTTHISHKLVGFDEDWVQDDIARRAHYGPLPPGSYRFEVIANSDDGASSGLGAVIALVVYPPMWRAWWFLTLCGLALVAMIWTIVRYVSLRRIHTELRRSEQQRVMERERARIAQDMHDEIGSKLSRISYLSEVAQQAVGGTPEASGPVAAIAGTSRELLQALDEIVWAVNPRNDNLEHLAGYLEQYAREYFQSTLVECQICIPSLLPSVALNAEVRHNVFLAFEEALSNALKHAKATQVHLEMSVRNHAFEIVVRDNGCGFQGKGATLKVGQDGLTNMEERLRAVGGKCQIDSSLAIGTTVRLICPFPKEKTKGI